MMVRFIFSISMFISLIPVCVFAQAEEDVTNFRKNAVELVERFYSGLPQFCMDKEYKRSFIQNNIDKNAKFKPDFSTDEPEQYLDINQYIQVFLYAYRPDIKKEEIKFVRNKFDYSQLYPTTDNRGYNLIVYFFNSIRTSKVSLQKEVAFYCTFPDKSNPDYILISQIEPKEKEVVAISGASNSGSNTNSDNTTELYNKAVRFYTDSDYKSAFTLFKQLAESGNAKAQNYVGSMYQYNKGIAQNNIEAVKWFRKSADQGNSSAQCSLGYMYYSATGVSRNYAEAIKWFRESAEQGNSTAMYNMGLMYKNGYGVQKDNTEAINWFRKAKEGGDKDADIQLKLLNVDDLTDSYDKAVRFYNSSDYKSAFPLFKQLAESGSADAQNFIGVMYDKGNGVVQDYVEAVKWFRKSAEQNNALGQSNLGVMYNNGRGIARDDTEAVEWYRESAEQGSASGQLYLGYMYDKGSGVAQDYVEAVKWYRKSAEQGNSTAMYNLGIMYKNGNGVQKDTAEAVNWFKKAKENGDKDADGQLEQMGVIEIKRTR